MKTFILDTNVLIHDPDAINAFEDNEVILPWTVLEELDKLKKRNGWEGYAAREAIRKLEEYSTENHGSSLMSGVSTPSGGVLKVLSPLFDSTLDIDIDSIKDNKILMTVYAYKKEHPETIFVSKDINARIKARALNIEAQDYERSKIDISTLYKGYREVYVPTDWIKDIHVNGNLPLRKKQFKSFMNEEDKFPLYNEFVIFKSMESESISALAIRRDKFYLVKPNYNNKYNIIPKNVEQIFALNLLMNDNIKIVSFIGPAGTGKTFLSLIAALQKTIETQKYKKILISKPVIPLEGQELGFLPGDKFEKLEPWMQSYFDNLEALVNDYFYLLESGSLEIEALTYVRGRTLKDRYILVDECQNITPHAIKTITSRVGENSKIILLGDIEQIDAPYLDKFSNGLVYFVERLKGEKIYGHITLTKTLRSEVAELVAAKL